MHPVPAPKAAETAAPETELTTPEEPGDANLPGGGNGDPAGQNVDRQLDGVG